MNNAYPHHCPICKVTSAGAECCINDHCGGDPARYRRAQMRNDDLSELRKALDDAIDASLRDAASSYGEKGSQ